MTDDFNPDWGSSADQRRALWKESHRMQALAPASTGFQAYVRSMPDEVRRRVITSMRTEQVLDQFSRVTDPFILRHVNSVYLMHSKTLEGAYDLVVYLDNSTCAAELNARRELIRLKYRELFDVTVDVFEIRTSRARYRDNHPFVERENTPYGASVYQAEQDARTVERELTAVEQQEIDDMVASLPAGRMRDSFVRALTAQKKRKKGTT